MSSSVGRPTVRSSSPSPRSSAQPGEFGAARGPAGSCEPRRECRRSARLAPQPLRKGLEREAIRDAEGDSRDSRVLRPPSVSGVPSATISPATITATRSASAAPRPCSGSSGRSSCRASRRSLITSHAWWRAAGSKPVVGSSRKTSSGSPISASATSSRRTCPPESWSARASRFSARPTSSIVSADRSRMRVVAGVKLDELADRQLGGHRARTAAPGRSGHASRRRRAAGPAEHAHLAADALAVALEDLDGRRLAGPVGSEEREHLAAPDLQVDSAHDLDVAVGLAKSSYINHRPGGAGGWHRGDYRAWRRRRPGTALRASIPALTHPWPRHDATPEHRASFADAEPRSYWLDVLPPRSPQPPLEQERGMRPVHRRRGLHRPMGGAARQAARAAAGRRGRRGRALR